MCEVGELFTGYCEGYFGRESYGEKRVEAFGADWILCREENGSIVLATFHNREEKILSVERWRSEVI